MKASRRSTRLTALGLVALGGLSACASGQSRLSPLGRDEVPFSVDNSFVYECANGFRFSVSVIPDTVNLRYGDERAALPRVVAASGERYSADGITFWNKGMEAMLETPSFSYAECQGFHAPTPWVTASLLGYDFRAAGGQAAWQLEIDNDGGFWFTTDSGETETHVSRTPDRIAESSNSWSYSSRIDSRTVRIFIEESGCRDVASGESFPAYVTLTVDGEEFVGCGRSVEGMHASPLEFNDWRLTHIDSRPIPNNISMQPMGVRFDMAGARIFGFAGCNSFIGPFSLIENERLLFRTPIITTRLNCPAFDVEQLERRFFVALDRTDRYVLEDDQLTFYSGNSPVLRFRADTL